MAISEAKRKANKKWNAENLATLACQLNKKDAEIFKKYCNSIGSTPNSTLKSYVLECNKKYSELLDAIPDMIEGEGVTLEAVEGLD